MTDQVAKASDMVARLNYVASHCAPRWKKLLREAAAELAKRDAEIAELRRWAWKDEQ